MKNSTAFLIVIFALLLSGKSGLGQNQMGIFDGSLDVGNCSLKGASEYSAKDQT